LLLLGLWGLWQHPWTLLLLGLLGLWHHPRALLLLGLLGLWQHPRALLLLGLWEHPRALLLLGLWGLWQHPRALLLLGLLGLWQHPWTLLLLGLLGLWHHPRALLLLGLLGLWQHPWTLLLLGLLGLLHHLRALLLRVSSRKQHEGARGRQLLLHGLLLGLLGLLLQLLCAPQCSDGLLLGLPLATSSSCSLQAPSHSHARLPVELQGHQVCIMPECWRALELEASCCPLLQLQGNTGVVVPAHGRVVHHPRLSAVEHVQVPKQADLPLCCDGPKAAAQLRLG
jgi:hypothetical protein